MYKEKFDHGKYYQKDNWEIYYFCGFDLMAMEIFSEFENINVIGASRIICDEPFKEGTVDLSHIKLFSQLLKEIKKDYLFTLNWSWQDKIYFIFYHGECTLQADRSIDFQPFIKKLLLNNGLNPDMVLNILHKNKEVYVHLEEIKDDGSYDNTSNQMAEEEGVPF
jgi:hypothetical protein